MHPHPVPISALQHWIFCHRQCGLIHLERLWDENVHTAQGRVMHNKVHTESGRRRGPVYTAHGLELCSHSLGLVGVADAVEFHTREKGRPPRPFPVEHKCGKAKKHEADKVQLCAQALCLEEMTGQPVPAGALFYGQTRRRLDVDFTSQLRDKTAHAAQSVRRMLLAEELPPPAPGPGCKNCSLLAECMPHVVGKRSAAAYLAAIVEDT